MCLSPEQQLTNQRGRTQNKDGLLAIAGQETDSQAPDAPPNKVDGAQPVKAETSVGDKFASPTRRRVNRRRQTASEGAVAPGRVFGKAPVRVLG